MDICGLRHAGGNTPHYLVLTIGDGRVVLTVQRDDIFVCDYCPNVHVQMFEHATPSELRDAAQGLLVMAAELEAHEQ